MNVGLPAVIKPRRLLSARRLVLLATVAALSGGVLFHAPIGSSGFSPFVSEAHAQSAGRPVGFADIVDKVKPSVISVRVKMDAGAQTTGLGGDEQAVPKGSPFEFFFRRFGDQDGQGPDSPRGQRRHQFTMGQGSGFFISSDGFAVTNNHVVEKAESVEVTTDDGKTYTAKVIGTDPRTDLALIKIDGRSDFPAVKLSEHAPRIGVNTAIFSPSGGSVGIAFAIPADTVKTVVAQLKDKGAVTRGWIGVQIQPVTADIADSLGIKKAEGALVAEPQAGSPAAKAGIKSGDVILSVNGEPVKDARALARTISTMAPGTSVKLGLLHSGKEDTVTVTLGELPKERQARADTDEQRDSQSSDMPKLGLSLAPANKASGYDGDGVVVTGVDPSGPAADHGFKTGDVILEVSGKIVSTPADVSKAVGDARTSGKRTVLMRVKSGEATRFVAIPLGNA